MTHSIKEISKKRTPTPMPVTVIRGLHSGLQIFELKQLADMEDGYKRQCRAALKAYKSWLRAHRGETDVIELLYGAMEGAMLRRHAEDSVHMYWTIRQDFRRGFKEYLDKNCCYPSNNSKSKAVA